ncbi:MAG: hypothetical protein HY809_01785 [Nitrospirae bacterium]|nr:hypothetical protein [Nitrospirota bacterium]
MEIRPIDLPLAAAINLYLALSWHFFLFRKRSSVSFADRLIGAFMLSLAQIIATELVLGVIFKQLHAAPLFILNSSISSIVFIFLSLKNKGLQIGQAWKEAKEKIAWLFKIIKSDLILFIIFLLFLSETAWLIFLGYLFPSYTWDALWYHLPIVGQIMQSGAIQENPANFMIDTFINIFPKNMELFFLWNVIFLKSDVIADLSQLPFTIIGIVTTYSIAVKLRINDKHALYSSLLFFFTPIILLQSTTNYVDVSVSVLLIAAINFLLYENSGFKSLASIPEPGFERQVPILLAGISTGILFGSKGSGPLFVIIISLAIAVQEAVKMRGKERLLKKSLALYGIYFYLPMLLLGSYWYIKNAVLYGNPVYPMEITVFNRTLLKGLYKGMIDPAPSLIENSSSVISLFYVWMERVEYYLYDSRLSGFGPLWFILFLPSLAYAVFYSIVKKRFDWLFITALLIAVFIAHPRNWNTRYVIFIVALGALSFGFVLDRLGSRASALRLTALLLVSYTFLTANSPCVMPDKIIEFLKLPQSERTISRHAPFNIDLHAKQEYSQWKWIHDNVSEGETLAYTFEPLFLSPLWNSRFSNKIIYLKSEKYAEWFKSLKENNVTYVLLRKASKEDEWIEKEKKALANIGGWFGRPREKFRVVYSDGNYNIMKLINAENR